MLTACPLYLISRFSTCWWPMSNLQVVSKPFSFPSHKKVPVAIRVLQTDEPAAPSLVPGLSHTDVLRSQALIELIDVGHAQHKVRTTSAFQHGLKLLHETNSQRAGSDRSDWPVSLCRV